MAKEKVVMLEPSVELQKMVEKYQLSIAQIAEDFGLSQSGIRQILAGKTRISTAVGLKFSKYFNKAEDYWINIQTKYDLAEAKKDPEIIESLKNIKPAKVQEKKADPKAASAKKPAAAKSSSAKTSADTKKKGQAASIKTKSSK
jgi:addiction module HigA family antidote